MQRVEEHVFCKYQHFLKVFAGFACEAVMERHTMAHVALNFPIQKYSFWVLRKGLGNL